MSVEKVNKYKENKKNRKEILEKERKKKKLYRIGGWAAGIVVVGGLVLMLGLTAKNSYNDYLAAQPDYSSDSVIISDMTGILETEEAEGTVEDETAEGETAEDETAETSDETDETAEETKAE